jgi:hypothetical protein
MMSSRQDHRLVRDYLDRLDAALAPTPYGRARELREQIAAHIDDALPDGADELQIVAVLDRLGPPEEIASEAGGGEGHAVDATRGARRRRLTSRVRRREILVGAALCMSAAALAISLQPGGTGAPPASHSVTAVATRVQDLDAASQAARTQAAVAARCGAPSAPVPQIRRSCAR